MALPCLGNDILIMTAYTDTALAATPSVAPVTPTPAVTPAPSIRFADLALIEQLQHALKDKNYTEPSPIQAQTIPHLLQGRDVIGCAQTGTGKTAAFALPILQHLAANPKPPMARRTRALILAPTRELAIQIDQSFAAYGKYLKLSHTVVFGGVGIGGQIRALSRGVDILIATPGRLADLERQKHVSLENVDFFVLDEADRMLDQGFIHEIKRIIKKLPVKRQSLLFSATMPRAIEELAATIVTNAVRVDVAPESTTAERVEQFVCFVKPGDKLKLLVHTLKTHTDGLVLVFVRMKHLANRIADQLADNGIMAEAIHGNKSQGARQRALENFRTGRRRIMIATDIAARGIDVKGISLVINFNLPEEPEAYVHRIGRTARAGKAGLAIAFCDPTERPLLRAIERVIRQHVPVMHDHPFHSVPSQADQRESLEPGRHPHSRRSQPGRQSRPARPNYSDSRGARNGQATHSNSAPRIHIEARTQQGSETQHADWRPVVRQSQPRSQNAQRPQGGHSSHPGKSFAKPHRRSISRQERRGKW